MNTGALMLKENYIDANIVGQIYKQINSGDWKPVWEDGSYADQNWREIKLIDNYESTPFYELFPEVQKVTDGFKTQIINMMFYSMLPGGIINPHRDMIGNVGWGGLRFHIPIITNPNVFFNVSDERVIMNPGELWALDTSYVHSVANKGNEDRVHLVFDVKVNDWVINELLPPQNYKYYLHQAHLMVLYVKKGVSVLFNPNEFKNNVKMMSKIILMLRKK
jgi:hypothetical protein